MKEIRAGMNNSNMLFELGGFESLLITCCTKKIFKMCVQVDQELNCHLIAHFTQQDKTENRR